MDLKRGIIEGLREINAHRFRSFLTILGMVLGVSSLTAMFGITEGLAVGYKRILITIGGIERVNILEAPLPQEQENMQESAVDISYRDAQALRSLPLLSAVSPELLAPRTAAGIRTGSRLSRAGNVYYQRTRGVENDFLITDNREIVLGRFFTDLDYLHKNRVVVIGTLIRDNLWPKKNANPVGQKLKIDNQIFRVVGVFKESGMRWWDQRIVMPITTMQDTFASAQIINKVNQGPVTKLSKLTVQIKDMKYYDAILEQMQNIMNITHHGIMNYTFSTKEDYFEKIENQIFGARLSGGIISGVSLLVGGVSITNIMLASIRQRIREIGLRLAIGAKPRDIFMQIVVEAILLASLGGLLGLLGGWGLTNLLQYLAPSDNDPVLRTYAFVISYASAAFVGLLAGLYPGFKAANTDPVEALKYE
ncbi:MAG: ABC transporter permease [Verrucomicrobiota bacterium]